uniref:Ig-like domain-containing protein n=1 Tax=Electrophorus electricus TaxID=8005 RepID=A0AAY5ECC1_ELEEL
SQTSRVHQSCFKLIGPCKVEIQSGSAVTLSCHLWFKETDCVCLYKNGGVSLFTQELQRGNVSLQLRDYRVSDTGYYLCQVRNKQEEFLTLPQISISWLQHLKTINLIWNKSQISSV